MNKFGLLDDGGLTMNVQHCLADCKDLRNSLEFMEQHIDKLPREVWQDVYEMLTQIRELHHVLLYETPIRPTPVQCRHLYFARVRINELLSLLPQHICDE